MRLIRLCMMFMCALVCVHAFAQSSPLDLGTLAKLGTSQATLTGTFKSFNRVTKESVYDLKLANISGAPLHGPVFVTIEGLTPAGIQAKNPSGTTTSSLPYFTISTADVAAGASITLPISFINPANARLTFTLGGYATPVVTGPAPLTIEITHPGTLITVGA